MDEPVTKVRLLDMIRTARAEWDGLLSQVDETRMTQPGVAGEWSVKDVIAHITWHEREMIGMLRARTGRIESVGLAAGRTQPGHL